ncbi:transposase family protein [Streptomyces sp. NBC_01104]|nr:transposase family protein [Streptomyces sp. NBC_01104]
MAGAICPGCGVWSRRIHGTYLRFPADVPSGGRRVALCLRVRRFLCPIISCRRQTFAEQLPGLTRRYGRRTERLRSSWCGQAVLLTPPRRQQPARRPPPERADVRVHRIRRTHGTAGRRGNGMRRGYGVGLTMAPTAAMARCHGYARGSPFFGGCDS